MEYLQSKRDDVLFYWMCNSTFVNFNLTRYYKWTNSSAYVDGVYMKHHGISNEIRVLFSPFDVVPPGNGSIDKATWDSFSGLLVNDSIGQMDDASSHPSNWWDIYPPDFSVDVFFNDNTTFHFGYIKSEGLAYIMNGTWTGGYMANGWPEWTGYSSTVYWLIEGGHLQDALVQLYGIITNAVSYP